jgi:fatty acid desaturase
MYMCSPILDYTFDLNLTPYIIPNSHYLLGALCTIDRSFGPVLDHTFHHISDTHVCHHLFSKMPFHHAQEATEYIRKTLGKFV